MMYLSRTWPVGIPLLTDESFSSWFARIAWARGVTPSELYRIALPGGRIGGIDLDHHACDDLILNLSRHTGRAYARSSFGRADRDLSHMLTGCGLLAGQSGWIAREYY